MSSSGAVITGEDGKAHVLPSEVREQSTAKTSVYRQGTLVYDGATGQAVGPAAAQGAGAAGPGNSLNEMLKWSIENSDPEELARRAAEGEKHTPKQIDKEIMDMLLGQPIVAKMRECMGKLENACLADDAAGDLDEGAAALEELEYYAEDLDNALDLVKIGGLQTLMRCCAFGLPPVASSEGSSGDEMRAPLEAFFQ